MLYDWQGKKLLFLLFCAQCHRCIYNTGLGQNIESNSELAAVNPCKRFASVKYGTHWINIKEEMAKGQSPK